MTINAHFDGKTIVPDQPLDLPPNQPLIVRIEPVDGPGEPLEEPAVQESVPSRTVGRDGHSQTPSILVPISTLAPHPFTLLRDIPCLIQPADSGFLASFFDANISASGDTQQEALENLKSLLIDIYDDLVSEPPEKLGPEPARQLAVLKAVLKKRS